MKLNYCLQTILEHCQSSPLVKKLIFTSCMCGKCALFSRFMIDLTDRLPVLCMFSVRCCGPSAITDSFEYNRKYSEQDWNDTASPTSNVYSYRWVLSVGVGTVPVSDDVTAARPQRRVKLWLRLVGQMPPSN